MSLFPVAGHEIPQFAEGKQNRVAHHGAGDRHERALGEAALREAVTQVDDAFAVEVTAPATASTVGCWRGI